MYQGVLFIDIERFISKTDDSIKLALLQLQKNDYFLVICSPHSLKISRHLVGVELTCAFILFNGSLAFLNGQKIVNFPIYSSIIDEIKEFCEQMQHPIVYYTNEASLTEDKGDRIERFQEVFPLETFKPIHSIDQNEAIFQLRIFNLEQRRDMIYETFFERTLDCQRQDIYSFLAKNKKSNLSDTMFILLNEIELINHHHIYYLGNRLTNVVQPMKKIRDLAKIKRSLTEGSI